MSNSFTALVDKISGKNSSNPIFNFNIPSNLSAGLKTDSGTALSSLGDLTQKVNNAIDKFSQIANTVYCIGMAITNPSMLLNVLDMIGGQLMAIAMDMAQRILSVIEGQIMGLFNTVAGTILNVVNSVLSFLNAILDIFDALCNIYDNLKNLALSVWNKFMSQEDCEFMLAQMAMCILNKLFGSKLQQLEQKVTNKIVETGQKLNTALTNELADVNSMANYVRHESFMASKSAQQINMLFG